MSEALKKQREGYLAQLQQVEQGLQNVAQQKTRLEAQREQLKGAIFALDSLAQAEATEAATEEVSKSTTEEATESAEPAEESTEAKEA